MVAINHDASKTEPMATPGTINPGTYLATVIYSQRAPTRSQNGDCLKVYVQIISGPASGTIILETFNYWHNNVQAKEIAMKQFGALVAAVGHRGILADTAALHGKPVGIAVQNESFTIKDSTTGQDVEKMANRIKSFMSSNALTQNQAAQSLAVAQQEAQPQTQAQPAPAPAPSPAPAQPQAYPPAQAQQPPQQPPPQPQAAPAPAPAQTVPMQNQVNPGQVAPAPVAAPVQAQPTPEAVAAAAGMTNNGQQIPAQAPVQAPVQAPAQPPVQPQHLQVHAPQPGDNSGYSEPINEFEQARQIAQQTQELKQATWDASGQPGQGQAPPQV